MRNPAALLLLAIIAACGDEPSAATAIDAGPPDAGAALLVATVRENPRSPLSAYVDVTTPSAWPVRVAFWSARAPPQTTGASAASTSHTITVVGMRADTAYSLQAIAYPAGADPIEGPVMSFVTGPLPAGTPSVAVTTFDAARVQPGVTLFGVAAGLMPTAANGPIYIGVDAEGEIVWLYSDDGAQVSPDRDVRQLADGNLVLALPGEYRVVTIGGETVSALRGDAVGAPLHHDAVGLPGGGTAALSFETRDVDVAALGGVVPVRGDKLVEIAPDGAIVWEWSAFDGLDPTRFPGPLSQNQSAMGAYDWTHANALVHVPADDSFLVSARHQSWIVKVDHATGAVRWRLGDGGDFALEAGEWFYNQHAPEVGADGTVYVYDNGNERLGVASPYSRAVAYTLDEAARTATQRWEWRTGRYTSFLGDVDRLPNGNVLVCAGGDRSMTQLAHLTEVTFAEPAETLWELTVTGYVYRAARLETFWPE